jgi:hypothetical protein
MRITVPNRVLLQDLQDKTETVLQQAYAWQRLDWQLLITKPTNAGWSAAECLQHLILYDNYYLPHIQKAMNPKNFWKSLDTVYKSTIAGNYFANSMLPKETGEIKKMKSPKTKVPIASALQPDVLAQFIQQQLTLKEIFSQADKYNINKAVVPVSILPFIKINIGDALRFVVQHTMRHMKQANAAIQTNTPIHD